MRRPNPDEPSLGRRSVPHGADFGFREPLTPHLARPGRGRVAGSARVTRYFGRPKVSRKRRALGRRAPDRARGARGCTRDAVRPRYGAGSRRHPGARLNRRSSGVIRIGQDASCESHCFWPRSWAARSSAEAFDRLSRTSTTDRVNPLRTADWDGQPGATPARCPPAIPSSRAVHSGQPGP